MGIKMEKQIKEHSICINPLCSADVVQFDLIPPILMEMEKKNNKQKHNFLARSCLNLKDSSSKVQAEIER